MSPGQGSIVLAGEQGLTLGAMVFGSLLLLFGVISAGCVYQTTKANDLLFAPYKRVVVLHGVLLGTGFIAAEIDAPIWPLAVLVLLKIGIDLAGHVYEHRREKTLGYADLAESQGEILGPGQWMNATAAPPPAAAPDAGHRPLSQYIGRWHLAPGEPNEPGWFALAALRESGGTLKAALWSWAHAGPVADGELEASLHGRTERVEFIELRHAGSGKVRILRFSASALGIVLNEVHYPEGNAKAMQARSFALERVVKP